MLELVYMALLVLPLLLVSVAMVLLAVRALRDRGARSEPDAPARKGRRGLPRRVVSALANDPPRRSRRAPAPEPALEVARRPREPRRGPALDELSALVESLAFPPQEQSATPVPAAPVATTPRIGAPPAETKHCPDCAEEVLAAARVCKHCRYRFDEPDLRAVSA